MRPIRPVDCGRIDGGIVRRRDDSAGDLGHVGSLKARLAVAGEVSLILRTGRRVAVRPGHRETRPGGALERSAAGVDALAAAGVAAARASTLTDALQPLADALARAAAADVVIVRIREDDHQLRAVAVATRSPAVAAELEATRVPVSELEGRDGAGIEALPVVTRRAAERLRATVSLVAPIMVASTFAGTIELLRAGESFDDADRSLAALAAAQAALAVRAFGDDRRPGAAGAGMLSLAGEALVAVTDEDRAPEHVTRLAVEATGALAGLLWRSGWRPSSLSWPWGGCCGC